MARKINEKSNIQSSAPDQYDNADNLVDSELKTLLSTLLTDDSAVTGMHLDIFIKLMRLHGQTKKTLLGLSDPAYTRAIHNPSEIISNPPTALLIRFLFKHPERFFVPRVTFTQLLELTGLSEEQMSLVIGRHYLSASRYIHSKKKQEMRIATQRLSYHIYSDIKSKARDVKYFVSLAKQEAHERGMKDLFSSKRWTVVNSKKLSPMTIMDLDWVRLTRNMTMAMLMTYLGVNRVDSNLLRDYLDYSDPNNSVFDPDKANKIGTTPISDASSALLLRYYKENPDSLVLPVEPTIENLLAVSKVPEREIGIMLGRDFFSAHRWKGRAKLDENGLGQSMHWSVQVLASYFMEEAKNNRLDAWREMVLNEGRHYGVQNVFESGSWNKNKQKD